MSAVSEQALAFGPFRLFPQQRLLLEGAVPVRIGSRAFDLLVALVESAGEPIGKEALLAKAWPHTVVDDAALRVQMSALRRTLGQGSDESRYIATIPQRGYSFVAAVTRGGESLRISGPESATLPVALPTLQVELLGRDDLLDTVAGQLESHRVVTLAGPGGIGKTAAALGLAQRVSSRFEHGARFIDLAPVSNPANVGSAVAMAVGTSVTAADTIERVVAAVQDSDVLLVIDNCEHVIDAAADLVDALVRGTRRVKIIATSREPLRVRGEVVHRMQALKVPHERVQTAREALTFPAVQLLVERAAAVLGSFDLSDADAAIVGDICTRLDGIPLAVELAAGRIDQFGLRPLASLLDDHLGMLTRGMRTAPPRQQTLRATLDWSYRLLSPQEQVLLGELSVFRSRFTLDCAAALHGEDVRDSISALTSKSMLTLDVQGNAVRYRLPETTRSYAHGKLTESGAAAAAHRRHAERLLVVARVMQSEWDAEPGPAWIARHEGTVDDVRSAIDWAFSAGGDLNLGIQLTLASTVLFNQLSLMEECRSNVLRALQRIELLAQRDYEAEIRLTKALAHLSMHTRGLGEEVTKAFQRVKEIGETTGDITHRALGLGGMWLERFTSADFQEAAAYARQYAALPGAGSRTDLRQTDRYMDAMVLLYEGHIAAADALAREDLGESTGRLSHCTLQADRRVALQVLRCRTLWLSGRTDAALETAHEATERAQRDNAVLLGQCLAFGALPVAFWSGDLCLAARWTRQLLQHTQRHGLTYWNEWGRAYELLLLGKDSDRDLTERWRTTRVWPLQHDTLQTIDTRFLPHERSMQSALSRSAWSRPEVLRRCAEMLMGEESADTCRTARDMLQQALVLARDQGAAAWELRISLTMASMKRRAGRGFEADAMVNASLERLQNAGFRPAQAG